MRIDEIIRYNSSNELYHMTTLNGIQKIIKSKMILPSNKKTARPDTLGFAGDTGAVSLTRNRNYWAPDTEIAIVIDRNTLSQSHKIIPFSITNRRTADSDESEERTYKSIPFSNQYIKLVIFQQSLLRIPVRPKPPSDQWTWQLNKKTLSIVKMIENIGIKVSYHKLDGTLHNTIDDVFNKVDNPNKITYSPL